MWIALVASSLLLIVLVLADGFETMLLPRRVTRSLRFARYFYRSTWRPWAAVGRLLPAGRRRHGFLSLYGPLSIVVLFAAWAIGLILGFAGLQGGLGVPLNRPGGGSGPSDYLYLSGVTFFTLGYGDVTPAGPLGRSIAVVEAGVGFGFLAAVIGYLPVLYGAFSRREVTISLLDARAGSPPTAAQVLLRVAVGRGPDLFSRYLEEWERWAAEILETHLSFPVLTFYRSQHDNQSWLAALTAILDACAILIARIEGPDTFQAQLTFAMARHAVVDLSQIYGTPPRAVGGPRIGEAEIAAFRDDLVAAGLVLRDGDEAARRHEELRSLYEPFVNALAEYFVLTLPPIVPGRGVVDNWQTSAWMRRSSGINRLSIVPVYDDQADASAESMSEVRRGDDLRV